MRIPTRALGLAQDHGWRRLSWWKLVARYPWIAFRVMVHRAHWRIEWELEAIAGALARFTQGWLWQEVPGIVLRSGKLVRREAALWKRIGIVLNRDAFLFARRAVRIPFPEGENVPKWARWPWRDEWGPILPTPGLEFLVRAARTYWAHRYDLERLLYRMGFLELATGGAHYLDGEYRLRWWRTWEYRLEKAADGMVDGAALWVRAQFSAADVTLLRDEVFMHTKMADLLGDDISSLSTAAKSRDRATKHQDLANRIQSLLSRSVPVSPGVQAALEAVEKRLRKDEKRATDAT